jgi:hypothetical protein
MKSFIISLSNANKHNDMEFFGCFGFTEFKFSIRDEVFQTKDTWKLLATKLIINNSYEVKDISLLVEQVLKDEGYITVTNKNDVEFTLFINENGNISAYYSDKDGENKYEFYDLSRAKAEMLAVILANELGDTRIEEITQL